MVDKNKGKHRGQPVQVTRKQAEAKKQTDDVKFWRDVAEDSGVLPHDPNDPRNKSRPKPGKHRK